MPCTDGGVPHHDARVDSLEARVLILEMRLNERTAQLCEVLKELQFRDTFIYSLIPQNIRDWHEEHKEFDKKRRSTVSGPKE